jgi:hypothetical protein
MLVSWALSLGLLTANSPSPPLPRPSLWRHGSEPRVSIWTDRENPYRRGERVRVFASPRVDGYLTVFRVDTDGGLRVLFPREPWADTWLRGGRTVELDDAPGRSAFLVDDYPGVGYVFAITSPDPFDYSSIVRRDQWDYREIANGRIHSDPYVALTALAERIAPGGAYDYDVTPYYVERRYDYPRFVCYDCHSYSPYSSWNPYSSSCKRYRIVVYDDPYYYPYQAYGGRVVVPGRPARLEPRYVFEDADGRSPWVTRTHRAQTGPVQAGAPYRERQGEREPVAVPVPSRQPGVRERAPEPAESRDAPSGGQSPAPRRREAPPSLAPAVPRTTGEPELRRRKLEPKTQDPSAERR